MKSIKYAMCCFAALSLLLAGCAEPEQKAPEGSGEPAPEDTKEVTIKKEQIMKKKIIYLTTCIFFIALSTVANAEGDVI